jgi:hypothetical protein
MQDCYQNVVEPENKLTVFSFNTVLSSLNNNAYRRGTSSLVVLEETFRNFLFGMSFDPDEPMYEEINGIIFYLLAGGFFDFEEETNLKRRKNYKYHDDLGPQVLTMEHLQIGFQICSVVLGVSMVAFVVEAGCDRLILLLDDLGYLMKYLVVHIWKMLRKFLFWSIGKFRSVGDVTRKEDRKRKENEDMNQKGI